MNQKNQTSSVSNGYADHSLLGKQTGYSASYDPDLLHAIARKAYRETIENLFIETESARIQGFDIWQCYEVSWLNEKGKPVVCCLTLSVPSCSESIFESKSLKLYLNSFNQIRFPDENKVLKTIKTDLSNCVGCDINLHSYPVDSTSNEKNACNSFLVKPQLLDALDIECNDYQRAPSLLFPQKKEQKLIIEESVRSHLLRSNCPVTNQPDWASITIQYKGQAINKESLLQYIVSYREHSGFHEQCVEQIFSDLMNKFDLEKLLVYAQYTRRGGIDINPLRVTGYELDHYTMKRVLRQ